MILGDPEAPHIVNGERTTLDDLFREAARRNPDRLALADPDNRASFTDGEPRRLNYRDAEYVISAMASRLRRLGLPTDSVIALQLPNTVEGVLAILGVLRAGMIAAPLPLLWRRADAVAALGRLGARALITSARIGAVDHGAVAMEIAAELFSIRHVCSFGRQVGDGMLPFDDLFDNGLPELALPLPRNGNPAAHVAIVTWDVSPHGMVAVARSHSQLIASARAVFDGGASLQNSTILTPCPQSSVAGLALGLLPWLIGGGMLSLHQPFDPEGFAAQCRRDRCGIVVLPGSVLQQISDAGLLEHDDLRNVLALWRAPERMAGSSHWHRPGANLVDVLAFGETGILAVPRDASGRPMPIPLGRATNVEPVLTKNGTLALRGLMVPRHPFAPAIERNDMLRFARASDVPVDTGYACRNEPDGRAIVVTAPPPGLIRVGGYHFAQRELQHLVGTAADGVTFAALPDALTGHRLAAEVADRAAAQAALKARGANGLVVEVFGDPPQSQAA